MEQPSRVQQWQGLDDKTVLRLTAFSLDEIERKVDEHTRADQMAFDAVRNQNRWILTTVFAAVLEITTALILYVVLR